MNRFWTAIVVLAVLAGCGGAGVAPSHDAHASGAHPSGHEDHPVSSAVAVERPDWSPEEQYLLSGFRTDPMAGEPVDLRTCARQLDNLPEGAEFGVVCRIEHHFPAEQVGAYLFSDTDAARAAYEDRLTELGVTPNAPGDVSGCDFEGLMVGGVEEEETLPRSAVFLDELDVANIRILYPAEAVYAVARMTVRSSPPGHARPRSSA
jgi:hypothetical protein